MTGFDAANFFKQNKQLTGKNQDSVPPLVYSYVCCIIVTLNQAGVFWVTMMNDPNSFHAMENENAHFS